MNILKYDDFIYEYLNEADAQARKASLNDKRVAALKNVNAQFAKNKKALKLREREMLKAVAKQKKDINLKYTESKSKITNPD